MSGLRLGSSLHSAEERGSLSSTGSSKDSSGEWKEPSLLFLPWYSCPPGGGFQQPKAGIRNEVGGIEPEPLCPRQVL